MKTIKELLQELGYSALWTVLLTLLFLLFNMSENSLSDMLIALPYFVVLYFIFFLIGKDVVLVRMAKWIGLDFVKTMVFPLLMVLLYGSYLLLNKQNNFFGALPVVLYLIIAPALMFVARKVMYNNSKINWIDFTAFVLFLLPTTFIGGSYQGNLPFNGNGFDSVYRIAFMLIAVYSFNILWRLENVGFFAVLNWNYILTALWVWLVFYLFVMIVGYSVDFIKITGYEIAGYALLRKIALTLVITFLHTAIFEELFFRGILQNMLTKRIAQTKSWNIFWQWGLALLLPLAVCVGYTLKGGMQWFPALMTLIIFGAAFTIERSTKNESGVYTALAITSVIFGLVHYHSGAIVYIGFACVAGWAYGFTYIKTKNVFYSALVHTLVNCSTLIFGLEFIK